MYEIVDRVMAVLPSPGQNPTAEAVGPVYDTATVARLLGDVSTHAVASRRRAGSILAMKTSDGRMVYPTFQFITNEVDLKLVAVFKALRNAPRWSVALWMVTPTDDLANFTPLEWLRTGRPVADVLVSAHATAADWR